MGSFLTIWGPNGLFWGRGRAQKLFWGLLIYTSNFCFQSIALFLLYVVLSLWWEVGGGSQRLLSPNPTTVLVVLLLGLWLLFGCDNILVYD